jgi:diadenosine tetraphosphate (Ap4A) HIT family hydrolase
MHACEVQCRICAANVAELPHLNRAIWQDDQWLLRHARHPYGLPGWLTLYAKRHVAGIAHFSDEEATSFGPVLRRLEAELERVTGALRIYTVAMGESAPHFHGHLVPRYAGLPPEEATWNLFDFSRRASIGEVTVDESEVARIVDELQRRLNT